MLQSFSEAKNAEEEKKLIENATPKSTPAVKKEPLKRFSGIAE